MARPGRVAAPRLGRPVRRVPGQWQPFPAGPLALPTQPPRRPMRWLLAKTPDPRFGRKTPSACRCLALALWLQGANASRERRALCCVSGRWAAAYQEQVTASIRPSTRWLGAGTTNGRHLEAPTAARAWRRAAGGGRRWRMVADSSNHDDLLSPLPGRVAITACSFNQKY